MPTTLGTETLNLFEQSEMQKLHVEFEVAAANSVARGQLVKLDAAGKIVPAAAADPRYAHIGISIHDAAAGELATIMCAGFLVIWGEAQGVLATGPVEQGAFNGTTGLTEYVAVGGADDQAKNTRALGNSLDVAAADGDRIKVLLTL